MVGWCLEALWVLSLFLLETSTNDQRCQLVDLMN